MTGNDLPKNAIEKMVMGFHLDVFRHVNNTRYLEFYEEARWIMYQDALNVLVAKGFGIVVANININYRIALELFDKILITAELEKVGSRSFVIRQTITSLSGDKLYSDADFTVVLIEANTQKAAVIADHPACQAFIKACSQLTANESFI